MNKKSLSGIDKKLILPLLSASAVLRYETQFKYLLIKSKKINIPRKKIYEAILQTYLFAGFPVALISLKIVNELFPLQKSIYETLNISLMKKRGVHTCRKVYGNKYEKLIENIKIFSPEMSEWLVAEGYGKVLSRKGLSLKERELCIICILASLNFEDQLFSHINGAYRLGMKISEIQNVIQSLDLLGRKKLSKMGLFILKKFESQKEKKSRPKSNS